MVIKIHKDTEIIWPVVVLCLLYCFALGGEEMYIVCWGLIGVYFLYKRRFVIPKVPVLVPYLLLIVFLTLVGLAKYETENVIGDLFYETTDLVAIILGYYFYDAYGKEKSMWKTLCLVGTLFSLITLISGVGSIATGADFSTMRLGFSSRVTYIQFILPLLVGKRMVLNEDTFSKPRDVLMIAIMGTHIVLCMGRTQLVDFGVCLAVFIVLVLIIGNYSTKLMRRILASIICVILLFILVWNVLPTSATERLAEKFGDSFSEIDSSAEFNSQSDAQNNWRGYENYCAKEQWKDSNLLEQLLGEGNGKAIEIGFVPAEFKDILVTQNGKAGIKILHNTYYTLLVKGGLIAVVMLCLFFLRNIGKGVRFMRGRPKEDMFCGLVLIVLCIGIIINAYIVRCMFEKSMNLSTMLLFGWVNAEINEKYKQKRDVPNETACGIHQTES